MLLRCRQPVDNLLGQMRTSMIGVKGQRAGAARKLDRQRSAAAGWRPAQEAAAAAAASTAPDPSSLPVHMCAKASNSST